MLSVVIPVYNRELLIQATLRSLLAQERVADEILIVDDGSTDNTATIAESFGSPVRVIRQTSQGPSAARNRGLQEARGEFVHFFDSDDLALPNLHKLQIQALESSGADIAYSPWVKARLTPGYGVMPTNHVLQAKGLPRGSLIRALLSNWSIVPIACLVRRKKALEVGGFPEYLRCGEDQLFFLAILLAGGHVVHTPNTLVIYRNDNHNALSKPSTTGGKKRQCLDWARMLVRARSLCLTKECDPARWFAFRRRAYQALKDARQYPGVPLSLLISLQEVLHASVTPPIAYTLTRVLQQKGEGLTARLKKKRAHRSFRSAPLSEELRALCSRHLECHES